MIESFEPPKAYEPKNVDTLLSERHTILEPKLDGVRGIIHCHPEDGIIILSRNKNKDGAYSQFQDNIPHIRDHQTLKDLSKAGYTILDCEVLAPVDDDTLGNTMSIIGALPAKAIEVQEKIGLAYVTLFDVVTYKGVKVDGCTWRFRRKLLDEIVLDAYIQRIHYYEKTTVADKRKLAKELIQHGYEGVVLKDPSAGYKDSRAWLKHKERTTIDAQIIGWTPGKGKYSNNIGALKTAVLGKDNKLKFLCTVSPGTDTKRKELYDRFLPLTEKQITALNMIVEIEGQQITKDNSIRHPRILRYREDKSQPNRL